jgi:hypothetical protein
MGIPVDKAFLQAISRNNSVVEAGEAAWMTETERLVATVALASPLTSRVKQFPTVGEVAEQPEALRGVEMVVMVVVVMAEFWMAPQTKAPQSKEWQIPEVVVVVQRPGVRRGFKEVPAVPAWSSFPTA